MVDYFHLLNISNIPRSCPVSPTSCVYLIRGNVLPYSARYMGTTKDITYGTTFNQGTLTLPGCYYNYASLLDSRQKHGSRERTSASKEEPTSKFEVGRLGQTLSSRSHRRPLSYGIGQAMAEDELLHRCAEAEQISAPPELRSESSSSNIDDESLAALRALLQRESHPVCACGRAYIGKLTMWRDHLLSLADDLFLLEEVTATAPSRSRGDTDDSSNEDDDSPTAIRKRKMSGVVYPDQEPQLLLEWRNTVTEWFSDFARHEKFESNTAMVALSYLDTYSMSICFPEEYSRLTGVSCLDNDEDTSYCNEEREEGVVTPSPKRRKTSRHVGRSQQQQQEKNEFFEEEVGGFEPIHYELAAVASLYMASKVCQTYPGVYSSSNFARYSCYKFSEADIEEMESDILQALQYRLHPPTSLRFIQELMPLLMSCDDDDNYAFDSSPWTPRDETEETIYFGANWIANLAAFCCAATSFAPIVSASPSKIALAAIVETAGRHFFNENLVFPQHAFVERLLCLKDVAYDAEVISIQKCLKEFQDINDREDNARGGSPVTVAESLTEATKDSTNADSSYAAEEKENVQAVSDKKNVQVVSSKKHDELSGAPLCAAGHSAEVNQLKSCPDGNDHRTWERADQCALAATAASRFSKHFAAEMNHSRSPLGA